MVEIPVVVSAHRKEGDQRRSLSVLRPCASCGRDVWVSIYMLDTVGGQPRFVGLECAPDYVQALTTPQEGGSDGS